ncbi:CBS domain-containing protein [Streptomyces sp. NPDC059649]|uniref:CBS domain-containing protein n=1 Tax=Streptomyces sp. NPDC059649 TaxID=3346895 RepID=UPI00367A6651
MRTRDVMRTPVVTVSPHTTLMETARRMRECTVGHIVVVSGETVQGVVTDRDLTVRGVAAGMSAGTPVSEVMTSPVVTVRADDDVEMAYHAMRRAGVRRIPVLAGGRLTGTVTMDDLLMDVSRRIGELLEPLSWCALAEPPGPPHTPEEPNGPHRTPERGRAPGL